MSFGKEDEKRNRLNPITCGDGKERNSGRD
jgi:hypothetical protein